MKLYIGYPKNGREGIYSLVSEEGESLASHFCSNKDFARSDLEARRPERQKKWKKKFGNYEVVFLGDDNMTEKKLIKLNQEFYKKKHKVKE